MNEININNIIDSIISFRRNKIISSTIEPSIEIYIREDVWRDIMNKTRGPVTHHIFDFVDCGGERLMGYPVHRIISKHHKPFTIIDSIERCS